MTSIMFGQSEPPCMRADDAALDPAGAMPSGDTLYVVDSLRQQLMAHLFDIDSGGLDAGAPYLRVPREHGMPDGITVDRDEAVWVVLAGGGAAPRHFTSGALHQQLILPTRYPTGCAFGGADLDGLFITTGSRPVNAEERPAEIARCAGARFTATVTTGGLPLSRMEV